MAKTNPSPNWLMTTCVCGPVHLCPSGPTVIEISREETPTCRSVELRCDVCGRSGVKSTNLALEREHAALRISA